MVRSILLLLSISLLVLWGERGEEAGKEGVYIPALTDGLGGRKGGRRRTEAEVASSKKYDGVRESNVMCLVCYTVLFIHCHRDIVVTFS